MVLRPLRLGVAAAVAAVTLTATACSSGDVRDPGPEPKASEVKSAGPLSAGVGKAGGGASIDPPPSDGPFKATFGSFVLCSTKPDAGDITNLRVTFPVAAPTHVSTWIRQVTVEDVRSAPKAHRAQFIPFSFGLGAPPLFKQPYAGLQPPGQFTRDVSSVTIDHTCAETNDAVSALNQRAVPETGYNELMVVVPSTSAGAVVDGFRVTYTADGKDFTMPVPWTMVVCDAAHSLPHCA